MTAGATGLRRAKLSRAPARRRQLAWVALLSLSCWGAAAADGPGSASGERARIDAERRSVETRFSQAQAACQGRFMLTSCLDAARHERRLALDRLQRQQLAIDDIARRERAALRRQALQNRSIDPPRPSAPAQTPPAGPAGMLAREAAPAGSATARHRATLPSPSSAATPVSAAAAQRNQADFLKRQQEAQDHRDAVLERNAQQDARHPPAAGLPVPPVAPASR